MANEQVITHCILDETSKRFLEKAIGRLNLSARAYFKVLKVARTIADLDKSGEVTSKHISEALQYRKRER